MKKINLAVFLGSGISITVEPKFDTEGNLHVEKEYETLLRKKFIELLQNPEWQPCFEFEDYYEVENEE